MSRLNKAQTYAISWLNSQNKNAEEIAAELNLNVEQVSKSLEKSSPNTNNSVKTGSEPVAEKHPDLMINKTAGKGNSGVSIMTKEASERNDAMRPKLNSGNILREDVIYRPKK